MTRPVAIFLDHRLCLSFFLAAVLLISFVETSPIASAEPLWRLRIHKNGGVEEFLVSDIDSLSFAPVEDSLALPMAAVPSGIFTIGDGYAGCGVDQHEVTLSRSFFIGEHEVTNAEYLTALQWAFDQGHVMVNDTAVYDNLDFSPVELLFLNHENCEIQYDGLGAFFLRESQAPQAQVAYPSGYPPAEHPVIMVTWYGAARFCDWLSMQAGLPRAYAHGGDWSCNGGDPYGASGYRLPTDAEWEFAAQWDDERIWPWGNEIPDATFANFSGIVGWTTPVGSYLSAPEELGLSDLAGNVYEWCNDWWECDLGSDSVVDPVGLETGDYRVVHGGDWYLGNYFMRCASRDISSPGSGYHHIGFRIAKTIAP